MNPLETALPTFISALLAWIIFRFVDDETQDPDFINFKNVLGDPSKLINSADTNWQMFKNALELYGLDQATNRKRVMRKWLAIIGWSAFGAGIIIGSFGAMKDMTFVQDLGLRYTVLVAGIAAVIDKVSSEILKKRLKALKRRMIS